MVAGPAPATRSRCGSPGRPATRDERGRVESEHFTYTVDERQRQPGADHRQRGLHRRQPDGPPPGARRSTSTSTSPRSQANGITPDVWDVDAQGVPHDLGVLSHYDAVLWYLGDNRLTQDPEDVLTELPYFGANVCPDTSVAERQQYLTLAVRDHLNEGGKLIHAGETAATTACSTTPRRRHRRHLLRARRRPRAAVRGHRRPVRATACCWPTTSPSTTSAPRTDEALEAPRASSARPARLAGDEAPFGGPATVDNPIDEAGAFIADERPAAARAVPAVRRRRPCWTTSVAGGAVHRRRGRVRRRRPTTPTRATCASGGRST